MSSGFVTETELADARQKRQLEWEKVRNADQPIEVPEEPYDGRSLFERLKEQKDKKDLEYEEAHKLKNMIRGLDDDEIDFLDLVDRSKMNAELKSQLEEKKELMEFRQRVATLQEKSLDDKIQAEISNPKPKTNKITPNRPSQKSILAGVVRKRKVSDTADEEQHNLTKKIANGCENKSEIIEIKSSSVEEATSAVNSVNNEKSLTTISTEKVVVKSALQCIGILPGIGPYEESSDSENSSYTDEDDLCSRVDLTGRKICKKVEEH